MKKTVLIFGITSFVGSNFAEVLSENFHVVGTYHNEEQFLPSHFSMLRCNVLNKEEVTRAIKFFKPDYVIYAVGISSLETAKGHPKEAEALNSTGAIN
ncbi:MAG: NAD-dependent epimerase/dehydratase family protein, partial [Bacteriovoracaceae bacterium]